MRPRGLVLDPPVKLAHNTFPPEVDLPDQAGIVGVAHLEVGPRHVEVEHLSPREALADRHGSWVGKVDDQVNRTRPAARAGRSASSAASAAREHSLNLRAWSAAAARPSARLDIRASSATVRAAGVTRSPSLSTGGTCCAMWRLTRPDDRTRASLVMTWTVDGQAATRGSPQTAAADVCDATRVESGSPRRADAWTSAAWRWTGVRVFQAASSIHPVTSSDPATPSGVDAETAKVAYQPKVAGIEGLRFAGSEHERHDHTTR